MMLPEQEPYTSYIYDKHTQENTIDFVDRVRQKLPFRIHTIQTDNGHKFQALFHWHCEDLGIRHVYIKKSFSPSKWKSRAITPKSQDLCNYGSIMMQLIRKKRNKKLQRLSLLLLEYFSLPDPSNPELP